MDLLSDIPDFVRAEISSSLPTPPPSATTEPFSSNPVFRKHWNELGAFVERIICPDTSFQELTLRDLLSSLPFGSTQATDAFGFWSSTAFPTQFKFTTFAHWTSITSTSPTTTTPTTLFVLESPGFEPNWNPLTRTIQIPKITNAATFVFLIQHFSPPSLTTPCRQQGLSVAKEEAGGGGEVTETDEEEEIVSCAYSAVPFDPSIHSHSHVSSHYDRGIFTPAAPASASPSTTLNVDDLLERWKRGETRGRTGKPTVEKIAELGGITQLDLKKWLSSNGFTWTQMLIKHGFRETQKSS
jgi:hypothetical protein